MFGKLIKKCVICNRNGAHKRTNLKYDDYEKNVFRHDITCCYVIRVDFMW